MRIRFTAVTLCTILFMAIAIHGEDKERSVVLPQKAADEIRHLCSRPGPPKFDSTWQITETDVKNMEANLSRITQLKSASGIRGMRLEHPEAFYRQYVGIVVGKRKLIYINAFCENRLALTGTHALFLFAMAAVVSGVRSMILARVNFLIFR